MNKLLYLIFILIGVICAYSVPAQTVTAGIGEDPLGKYISYYADTKKPKWGNRLVMGMTAKGRYQFERGWWTKTGINLGVNKILVTPYLCREAGEYWWEITLGFYGDRRYW